jgi:hypothetical protein
MFSNKAHHFPNLFQRAEVSSPSAMQLSVDMPYLSRLY